MKIVILAGGKGTRISEESHLRPKPMVEIGGMPILWHILKIYSYYGFNDFIICAGYKQEVIKDFFANLYLHSNDVTFDFRENGEIEIHKTKKIDPWKVTIVDTGLDTMTGGRIKRIQPYIGDETFGVTYGDGVSDINLRNVLEFHRSQKKMVTVSVVKPEGRFGILDLDDHNIVNSFREKSVSDTGWINGGFMFLEPSIFKYIGSDKTIFEKEPLENAAKQGEIVAYKHTGFWHCMDTLKDKEDLENLWNSGKAPWHLW